jgi:hypothetical protein
MQHIGATFLRLLTARPVCGKIKEKRRDENDRARCYVEI